jgi:prepilin-type N-terminal cleavage/methylation domain-containing protein
MTKSLNFKKGFTLLEILLVVGIISILAGIVILAINPTKQLGDTRNAQRRSDVLTILNAVYQYTLDNNGALPATIPDIVVDSECADEANDAAEICQDDGTCTGIVDLYTTLVSSDAKYLVNIPVDPSVTPAAGAGGGYNIVKLANGRVTVCAPEAENSIEIAITR